MDKQQKTKNSKTNNKRVKKCNLMAIDNSNCYNKFDNNVASTNVIIILSVKPNS